MLSQTTITVLIVLESLGLVATLSILGAAFIAWRKTKKKLDETNARFSALKVELKKFTDALSQI
jgi:hypothetical protein